MVFWNYLGIIKINVYIMENVLQIMHVEKVKDVDFKEESKDVSDNESINEYKMSHYIFSGSTSVR